MNVLYTVKFKEDDGKALVVGIGEGKLVLYQDADNMLLEVSPEEVVPYKELVF